MKIEKKVTAGANSPLRVPVSAVLCLSFFFLFVFSLLHSTETLFIPFMKRSYQTVHLKEVQNR